MTNTPSTADQLESFVSMVESSPHNLVSRRGRSELRSRHLPECVALAEWLPRGSQRVLDIGSGGGFPGIVLGIVRPDLDLHLLDATQKKVAFLEEVATELRLALTVHWGRAEKLAVPPLRGTFDIVTARAVAPLDRLVGLGVPFLTPGGHLYAVKGAKWAQEVDTAQSALRRVGARVVATPGDGVQPGAPSPSIVVVSREHAPSPSECTNT